MGYLVLAIPHDLLSLTLSFLNVTSVYSLSIMATKYSHNKIVRSVLFGRFVTIYMNIIHLDAIRHGHLDLFKWFVSDTKANPDVKRLYLKTAIQTNQLEIIK